PLMLELTNNPNMTILAFTEVKSIEGSCGNFKIKITKKPRYVDAAKCTACTDCFQVCPVGDVPMEFNFGRGSTKAIFFYSPFPPRKALINPEKCTYITNKKCGDGDKPLCVEACKPEAIDFSQKPQEIEINVGAVVLACGADETKDESLSKYGYKKYPDVLTSLEFERLLSGLGPTGGIVKRANEKEPRSITFIVTDDSYPVYFMSAVAEALGVIEKNPDTKISIIYKNVSLQKDSYEDFYKKSQDKGIRFICTDSIDTITVTEQENRSLNISYTKPDKTKENLNTEMLVLTIPLSVSSKNKKLLEKSGDGIFVCGTMHSVGGIDDALIQACSAAAKCSELLSSLRNTETLAPPKREFLPVKPEDEPSIAVIICRCGLNIAGLLDMDELVKYTVSLPYVKHVEVTPFGCDGVKLKELLQTNKFNRIVMGACSPKTHEFLFGMHSETAGLNRYLIEIVNLRNHCTWVHSKNKKQATEKSKILMKMGVSRAALLESLEDIQIPVTSSCLVVGGTQAGITCASKLANMGFQTHLVENGTDLKGIENMGPNVKVYKGAKIGDIKGYIGNYESEIVTPNGNIHIDTGAIVITTAKDMKASGTDYEKDLALQRDERNLFVPTLGILNLLDTNTDGVFICGDARIRSLNVQELSIEGEAASSRVAGIISKNIIIKSPTISFVVDENCDGCAYCVEPCPSNAVTLIEYLRQGQIKKTVDINEAICKGCGICMATCPKKGVFIRHFKPEYFDAMTKSLEPRPEEQFEPTILTFCCNWCSYAAADAAGTARLQYPSNVYIVRAMCTGMIHPNMIMDALNQGLADGVLVCGCHIGDCHYQEGNKKAEKRAEAIRLMLEDFGLEQERFRLEWVSASEGPKFAEVVKEMTETVKKLGPNPYRS
ncbi:MAG: hydrogenase iron-sulfur subunit, partial [Candidatus Hydrogenedentota bacterium]